MSTPAPVVVATSVATAAPFTATTTVPPPLMTPAQAQQALAAAQPAWQAAAAALNVVTPSAISELKQIKSPNEIVHHVMSAVLLLLGQTDMSWQNARKLLHQPGFITHLQLLNVGTIPPATLQLLRTGFTENEAAHCLAIEVVKKASIPAGQLANWIHAVDNFAKVNEYVQRLQQMAAPAAPAQQQPAQQQQNDDDE